MNNSRVQEIETQLTQCDVDFEILSHESPIRSREDALRYFKLEEIAPTLIIETETGMYALIISGDREKVDLEEIRLRLNCSEIRMAKSKDLKDKLGVKPGEVPLVTHGLPCVMQTSLFGLPYIYGGVGDPYKTLKIKPNDLKKMNDVIFCID